MVAFCIFKHWAVEDRFDAGRQSMDTVAMACANPSMCVRVLAPPKGMRSTVSRTTGTKGARCMGECPIKSNL